MPTPTRNTSGKGRDRRIEYHSCMTRFLMPLSAILINAVFLLAFIASPLANEDEVLAVLTIKGQADLKARLWERILLVTVKTTGTWGEDLTFLPQHFGQAIRVTRGQTTEVLTATLLVEGAGEILVTRPSLAGEPARQAVYKAGPTDNLTMLTRLACTGECPQVPATEAAPPESWGAGRRLFYVIPALADQPVLGQTASFGRQNAPLDRMIVVAGKLPPGTVLFDAHGGPVAIAVQGVPGKVGNTLAAILVLPKPEATEATAAATAAAAAAPAAASATGSPPLPATLPAPLAQPDLDFQPMPLGNQP